MKLAKYPPAKLAALKKKTDSLLSLEKITLKDIEGMDMAERQYLGEKATQKLAKLNGEDRDRFLEKIDLILSPVTKSDAWEANHDTITYAINKLMHQYGRMPSQSDIAAETNLSRTTIAKHLKNYKASPEFMAQIEQFKFMAPAVMANVFKHAVNGDMRAAKLYLEMMGAINKPQTTAMATAQNNYIQINNTILSQENLQQLTAEQLNQIEGIVRGRVG